MNIVVASAFRNSTSYLWRYFQQVEGLQNILGEQGHTLRVVAGEGDSRDHTLRALVECRTLNIQIVDTTHKGPVFGSTEHPERLKTLSKVGNQLFESVRKTDDILVYVESDLVWIPSVMAELVRRASTIEAGFDVFSPMIFAGPHFYDIWGFRKDGLRFGPFPPFHPCINGQPLVEVDSSGSCLVMSGEIARKCRIRNDYCLVGWCEDARSYGYRIAVCVDLKIHHP